MRAPRSQQPAPASGPFNPRKAMTVKGADVIWWAEVNQREPFVGMAAQLRTLAKRKGRGRAVVATYPDVLWHGNNTMEAAS